MRELGDLSTLSMTEAYREPVSYPSRETPVPEGQISFTLSDFIIAFIRRWYIFVAIVVLFFGAGVAYQLTRVEPPLTYKTSIQIGSRAGDGDIELANETVAKLNDAYIPQALQEHGAQQHYDVRRFSVEVKAAEGVPVINLFSYGSADAEKDILSIQQRAADLLIGDHERLVASTKRELEQRKFAIELDIEDTKRAIAALPQQKDILNQKIRLLEDQTKRLRQVLVSQEQDRAEAFKTLTRGGKGDASVLLLIGESITKNEDKLQALETQLLIGSLNDRVALDVAEMALHRKQSEKEQEVKEIQLQIDTIRKTALIFFPSRLLREAKPSSQKGIILFSLIGIIIGVFVVPTVEMVAAVLKQQSLSKRVVSEHTNS